VTIRTKDVIVPNRGAGESNAKPGVLLPDRTSDLNDADHPGEGAGEFQAVSRRGPAPDRSRTGTAHSASLQPVADVLPHRLRALGRTRGATTLVRSHALCPLRLSMPG
jgi:hypothetical protein